MWYPMPTSLWFTAADQHDDEHGYVCCSTCITDFAKWSGIGVSKWQRMHTPAQWMRYPQESWRISLTRSRELIELAEDLGAKAAKEVARKAAKRKRDESAPPAPPAPAESVMLSPSVASQVVESFSHTEEFLDNLLSHAQSAQQNAAHQNIDPAEPQNVLGPFAPAMPQNVLGPFAPAMPQNVLGPFAPAMPQPQNVLAPITQLSAADAQHLTQTLAKLEKLDDWIATALVEVRYVQKVVRNILRR